MDWHCLVVDAKLWKCPQETDMPNVVFAARYVLSRGTNILRTLEGHCYSTCLDQTAKCNIKRKFYNCSLATQAAFRKVP